MCSRIGIMNMLDENRSFNNVTGFALDAMNTNVFKRTENLLFDEVADFISDEVSFEAGIAENKVEEFANIIRSFAKKNPLYIATTILNLTLVGGAYLARKKR